MENYPSEEAVSVKSNQEKQRDRHGYPRGKGVLLHGTGQQYRMLLGHQ